MRIPYTIVPSDDGPDVSVPILLVHLGRTRSAEKPEESFPAIVDTGAAYSLFSSKMGTDLGFDIEAGRLQETVVSNGETMEFFIQTARLWFGEFVVDIEVGFGDDVEFPLLGRVGFFEHFRVTFDHTLFEIVPLNIGGLRVV